MDEEIMKKLALLNALKSENEDDGDIQVSSLHDAYVLLKRHMSADDGAYRRKLVAYITDCNNRVLASSDEYHNFIMNLFRVGDYDLALEVCDYALENTPYNFDILADAIKACGDSSQFDRCDKYLNKAAELSYDRWKWRLFVYSIDFFEKKLSAYPMNDKLFEKAIDLADLFIECHPYDEHGYNQKAELLIMMNRRAEAITTLKKYIMDIHPDESNSKSLLVTAQCCVTLLNLLDDSNDFDLIIEICDKGLLNTTQEQPSASIGFFMYRKALAIDAKAHVEGFKRPDLIDDALKFYQAAYDLCQDRDYCNTIERRYAVLRPYAANFTPLVKRELYVTEANASNAAE